MPPGHLAATALGQKRVRGIGSEQAVELHQIGGRTDESGGGRERAGRSAVVDLESLAEQRGHAMAAGERHMRGQRSIRRSLFQRGTRDDLARNPAGVGLAGDLLDDEPKQAKTVIGIFEPGIGADDRAVRQRLAQLGRIEKRPAHLPLAGVVAVPREARGVREQLRDRCRGGVGVEPGHMTAGLVVETQPSSVDET